MLARSTLVLALLTACGAAAPEFDPGPPPAVDPPAAPSITPAVYVHAELAESWMEAVALWTDAVGDAYRPRVVVSDECTPEGGTLCVRAVDRIPDCAGVGESWACTADGITTVARTVSPDMLVSTLAHEIGHTFGLVHQSGNGGLLDPLRSPEARRHPVVDEGTLVAFEASTGLQAVAQ